MMRSHSAQKGPRGRQNGSVLMLVLFVGLAVAVVTQTLAAVAVCTERALGDERAGRELMARADKCLAGLRKQATEEWAPRSREITQELPNVTEGELAAVGTGWWVMDAGVLQELPDSDLTARAWVERGRDGIDLPTGAMVAGRLLASQGRTVDWIVAEEGAEGSVTPVWVVDPPESPLLASGFGLTPLAHEWRLDGGWQQVPGEGASFAPGVIRLHGLKGQSLSLAEELDKSGGARTALTPTSAGLRGRSPDSPLLVLVTGGAELDGRNLGDLYGVLVVDQGSALVEGTTLHGALFATGTIDLGSSGQLVYDPAMLRWASDRSLCRTRLVPGSRSEGTE